MVKSMGINVSRMDDGQAVPGKRHVFNVDPYQDIVADQEKLQLEDATFSFSTTEIGEEEYIRGAVHDRNGHRLYHADLTREEAMELYETVDELVSDMVDTGPEDGPYQGHNFFFGIYDDVPDTETEFVLDNAALHVGASASFSDEDLERLQEEAEAGGDEETLAAEYIEHDSLMVKVIHDPSFHDNQFLPYMHEMGWEAAETLREELGTVLNTTD